MTSRIRTWWHRDGRRQWPTTSVVIALIICLVYVKYNAWKVYQSAFPANPIYWRTTHITVDQIYSISDDASNQLSNRSLLEINLRTERLMFIVKDSLAVLQNPNRDVNNKHHLSERFGIISHELMSLREFAGASEARETFAHEMKQRVFEDIYRRQHPKNCKTSKKLLCKVSRHRVGFASTIHHLLWCFVVGHYNNLTVITDFGDYMYFGEGEDRVSWESVFKPLTNCEHENSVDYYDAIEDDSVSPNDGFYRQAMINIPAKYVNIALITNEQLPWWYAQIVGYIMRPSESLRRRIRNAQKDLNISSGASYVSLHVRRSDKLHEEARSHPISRYMDHVTVYYKQKELASGPLKQKLVFLATDDASAMGELRLKYPEYQFLEQSNAIEHSLPHNRYSIEALYPLLIDTYLLANSDYIVCTLSSGFCRLAYELGLYLNAKPMFSAQSLDVPFHYAFAFNPPRVALYYNGPSNVDNSEWNMKPGDMFYGQESQFGSEWLTQAREHKVYDGQFSFSDYNQSEYKKIDLFKTKEKIGVRFEVVD